MKDHSGLEIPEDQFTSMVNQYLGCNCFRITLELNTDENSDQFTSVNIKFLFSFSIQTRCYIIFLQLFLRN